jgi:GrpB-like predicted nucleotidyltransferase (UPF0157 family)
MSQDLKLIPNDLSASRNIFSKEKLKLEKLLQDFATTIEHIGSTAIPHTIGKGIIDILLICSTEKDQQKIRDILVTQGYTQGELNKKPDGRLFFFSPDRQTQAGDIHLHVVLQNSSNLQSLALRDYLLAHPEEVKHYNQEKTRLSQNTDNTRHAYAVQKETFIKELLEKVNKKNATS